MEIAASHPISNGCADGADILTKLEADEQSNVRLSDFAGLGGERRPVGKYNFPPLLHQIVKNITEVYGDVSVTSRLSVSLTGEFYVVFCASIKEMSELRLEQVTENMILKWRDAIKDALRVRFKVDFAMEHLKKVACAYIGLMERRKLDSMASKISNLEAQLSVGKAEYCKISEMSKIYIDAADEFTGKAVSWGIFESSY
ncbi:hypothetical protein HRI_004250100 [Hibiscus trionum]|uniref:Uncharacterized protein n=1 Tax=Hibiscus trionum TaxID=183268 RepID=A0A9W7J2R5_HIBTR|nr:hypothetical protein HRI_004250100 [Hibiscus trionum]